MVFEVETNPLNSSLDVARNANLKALLVVFFALILGGCGATMPEKSTPAPQLNSTKPTCETADQNGSGEAGGACLPKGVIEITEDFPVNPEVQAQFDQATAFLQAEQYSDAIRLLKGVIGQTSNFTAPYINLGIAYSRTGDFENAEKQFNKAIELNSLHPVAKNELGLVYRKTGRYQDARALYEGLLATYPDFLPAHKNLGVLCDIYLQDLTCAHQQYEEYLQAIPDDKNVSIWIADVEKRM